MDVFLFSLTAALNPTLVAATTVMLLLDHPKRLMLGYLLGAYITSITLGLVIVFSLQGTQSVDTAQNTISPATNIALGTILLIVALVLGTGRDARLAELRARRKSRKPDKGPPRWQRALSEGSARTTFVVGALLTLPGGSYLAGLHRLAEDDLATAETVLAVIAFNLVMLMLLELPLIGFLFAPDWTPKAVARLKASLGRNARRIAVRGAVVLGGLLIVRGVIELIAAG